MTHALVSSIYSRGNESRAHYKATNSPTINGVPKNIRKPSKTVRINAFVHVFDTTCVDPKHNADESIWLLCNG